MQKKEQKEQDALDVRLITAASKGDLVEVKKALSAGAEMGANGAFALSIASECGHLEVAKYLVEQGIDVNANDGRALVMSAKNGHLAVVKFLVESGADPCQDHGAAFDWAVINGHLEIVEYLVSQGVNVEDGNDYALREADAYGYDAIFQCLLEAIDWQTKDENGETKLERIKRDEQYKNVVPTVEAYLHEKAEKFLAEKRAVEMAAAEHFQRHQEVVEFLRANAKPFLLRKRI